MSVLAKLLRLPRICRYLLYFFRRAMNSSSCSMVFCREVLRLPVPLTKVMFCAFWQTLSLRRSFLRCRRWISPPQCSESENSSLALLTNAGIFSMSLALFFRTVFFQTNLYLLEKDSIFVPSMKMFLREMTPNCSSRKSIWANSSLMQGARCFERNLEMVAWSGAGLPSRRYMKLTSRRQAVSILRELKIWFIPA